MTRRVARAAGKTRADDHDLRCSRFNCCIELCSTWWNKGDVVLLLIEEWQPAFSVQIGDNRTDEDVFRVLSWRGVGIKVGNPESSTAAQGSSHIANR
ncbi:MAG: trehalose-phosphatase [Syntrophobacteraceae bacterium]